MSPEIVDTTDDYYHVRYNDPDDYDTIRTPDWAENAASSVVDGTDTERPRGGRRLRLGHPERPRSH
jgi:hypothetical protein